MKIEIICNCVIYAKRPIVKNSIFYKNNIIFFNTTKKMAKPIVKFNLRYQKTETYLFNKNANKFTIKIYF